jgi:hypothetical protein
MDRAAISTKKALTASALNGQAVVVGGFVFCSGTVGLDSETVSVRDGIDAHTEHTVVNLAAMVESTEASVTSPSRPPSPIWMSRTSRISARRTAAACPIHTSQRHPLRDPNRRDGDQLERVTTPRPPHNGPEPRLWQSKEG